MSLNEKLAVEVMGWKPNLTPSGQLTGFLVDDYRFMHRTEWNPAGGNLNQLGECYLALSDDEKAFVQIKFAVPFNDLTNKWPSDRDNLFAVFTHPELVAKAILRAKGVSL